MAFPLNVFMKAMESPRQAYEMEAPKQAYEMEAQREQQQTEYPSRYVYPTMECRLQDTMDLLEKLLKDSADFGMTLYEKDKKQLAVVATVIQKAKENNIKQIVFKGEILSINVIMLLEKTGTIKSSNFVNRIDLP